MQKLLISTNSMKHIFHSFLLLFVTINIFAQSQQLPTTTNSAFDQSTINQAVEAGYTQDQIDAAISSKQSQSSLEMQTNTKGRSVINNQRAQIVNDSIMNSSFRELKRTELLDEQKLSELELLIEANELKERQKQEKMETELRKNSVFGSDIFMTKRLTFASNSNIATPKNYILGPGDEIVVNVWGNSTLSYNDAISPDGFINISTIGVIQLSGLTIREAEAKITSALQRHIEDICYESQVNISVGKMRSMMVNVTGEVKRPGSYTVPSVATVMHALYLAGGTNTIGSLRDITIYRAGKKIATLDVYDYILNGNEQGNITLKDGDNISVPTYASRAHATGNVKREMIYELKSDESLAKLLEYAGGFTSEAYKKDVTIYRKSNSILELLTVNSSLFGTLKVEDGDSLLVMGQTQEFVNRLSIKGAVWREGDYQISESINKLSQLIEAAGGLRGDEFASRGIITRKNSDFTLSTLSFSVTDIVSGKSDVDLQNNDIVTIPAINDMRQEQIVTIMGEVNLPDTFIYAKGMTVEDLIVISGGLKESASTASIEVSRRIKDINADSYSSKVGEVFTLSINDDLSSTGSDFMLEPFDQVFVRRSPAYSEQRNISVSGEAVFPGTYTITSDSTRLSDILGRIKGLTPEAYMEGISLKRHYTPEERQTVIDITKLLASYKGNLQDTLEIKRSLELDTISYNVGIDFKAAISNPGGSDDIKLIAGDSIFIPKMTNIVKTAGGLYYPNAMTYEKGSLKQYISKSGGYKKGAKRKPFIIYMNGKVESTKKFLFFASYPKVKPGCTIIVPVKSVEDRTGLGEIVTAASSVTSLATSVALLATGL